MRMDPFRATLALVVGIAAVSMSCASVPSSGLQDLQPPDAVREYLVDRLRADYASRSDSLELESVGFYSFRSKVLPGVVYHVGRYPLSTHGEILAVAASFDGQITPLVTIDDWNALARKAGRSRVQADPVRACEELVQNVGPRRHPVWRPVLYEGRRSLERGWVVGKDQIPAHARPPVASGTRGDRLVTAWFVEGGRLARYECRLSDGHASYSLLETVPNIGLFHGGS